MAKSNEDNDDLMDQYVSASLQSREYQGQFDGKALYACAFDLCCYELIYQS
jgi:hypothetical protein